MFHWADAHTYLTEEELSIELSLEEVEAAAKQLGFKVIKREMVPAAYMANLRYPTSQMLNSHFHDSREVKCHVTMANVMSKVDLIAAMQILTSHFLTVYMQSTNLR